MPQSNIDKVRLEASQPTVSAWVSANAGSGKTHLLVRRLLRLLLSGVAPHRILCLTYTKAAAAEMEQRILDKLAEWAVAEEGALAASLYEITGQEATPRSIEQARTLFAHLLDAPEGLRIETLHAFCQTLLKRFPLEASVPPHFTVIEEQTARELLAEATTRLYSDTLREGATTTPLAEAISYVAGRQSESTFRDIVASFAAARLKITEALTLSGGVAGAMARVREALGLKAGDDGDSILAALAGADPQHRELLRGAAAAFQRSQDAKCEAAGVVLAEWLETSVPKQNQFETYKSYFLTEKNTARKNLTGQKEVDALQLQALRSEQERVRECIDQLHALEVAVATQHALVIADEMLAGYSALKRARAMLDYHDLIFHACLLLAKPGISPWVMYKLDGGIDHVLVDEAQDTSPEQWFIVRKLTEEFYAGEGGNEEERTLFVVGDVKQSIFSFQGADPQSFEDMRTYFEGVSGAALKPFLNVTLPESFRSTATVLNAVDHVFAQEESALGAEGERIPVQHALTREGQAGQVELWPLLVKEDEKTEWSALRDYQRVRHPQSEMASLLADTIRGWLDTGEQLTARGRAMSAGDIMILVRKRGRLVDLLIREMKKRGIPVAGIDRMHLTNNLAVKDLMALGAFLLNPGDDYTLATVLKSPLAGLSEEQLFTLAHARGEKSLWQRVQSSADAHTLAAGAWLGGLLAKVDYFAPYELYSYALSSGALGKLLGRMGGEYADAVEEFLGQALLFERSHLPSLQGFLHWLEQGDTIIKRDMEQTRGQVRIMTVHGAKGLQAPVVILPDTADMPGIKPRFYWMESGGVSLPIWTPPKEYDCALTTTLRAEYSRREMAEYRRLLYVAMTRAEDRLYVCGSRGTKNASDECWHTLIRRGLAAHAVEIETPLGPGLRMQGVQNAPPKTEKARQAGEQLPPPLPTHALTQPRPESPLARPLAPSRAQHEAMAAASPLAAQAARARGVAIHRLLQYLPGVKAQLRANAAGEWLARYMPELGAQASDIAAQVMNVLEHPGFSMLFAPGSMAEVPVAGVVQVQGEMRVISGQIDRLAVTEKEVWIVDFKTQHSPPQSLNQIPAAYIGQMAAYRALIQHIYPGRTVRCILLFTASSALMEVPDTLLAARAVA